MQTVESRHEIIARFRIGTSMEEIMKGNTSLFNARISQWAGRLMMLLAAALLLTALATNADAQTITSFINTDGAHVAYIGMDSHVHQLFCPSSQNCNINSAWINQDLTADVGGPLAGLFSRIAGFSDSIGDHVFLVDQNQHIDQLLYTASSRIWVNSDLGVLNATGISGHADSSLEYLFYETNDQHVHLKKSLNGVTWTDLDLTGAPLAWQGSRITSFHDANGNHAFYMGANQHIYHLYDAPVIELSCSNTIFGRTCIAVTVMKWFNQDLFVFGGVTGEWPALTSFSDGQGEHVSYVGADWDVHEYLHDSSGKWSDTNVTLEFPAGAPTYDLTGTGLTNMSDGGTEYFFYVGTDLDVHADFMNGTWGGEDVSKMAGGPSVGVTHCYTSELTSFSRSWWIYRVPPYPSTLEIEDNIFYVANDGNIHRISKVSGLFPAYWHDQNLNASLFNACLQ